MPWIELYLLAGNTQLGQNYPQDIQKQLQIRGAEIFIVEFQQKLGVKSGDSVYKDSYPMYLQKRVDW